MVKYKWQQLMLNTYEGKSVTACLPVHLSVCLSVCPSVCMYVCLFVCLSGHQLIRANAKNFFMNVRNKLSVCHLGQDFSANLTFEVLAVTFLGEAPLRFSILGQVISSLSPSLPLSLFIYIFVFVSKISL
jgi:hypothetical protein